MTIVPCRECFALTARHKALAPAELRSRPSPDLLTIFHKRVDGRLTALCHAGVSTNVFEQVKCMSDQYSGYEEGAAEPVLVRALNHQEHWSYLLRIWRAGGDGGWRASLQSIPEGERHMFADLESLLAFLLGLSQ